jgi:hypothetical protein
MTLARRDIKTPVLPKEAVPVPELGGDVIVRGMLASERLALAELAFSPPAASPAPAAAPADADDLGSVLAAGSALSAPSQVDGFGVPYERIARVLARVVSIGDGKPLYTEPEWQVFGGQHPNVLLDLYAVAKRLSGMDDAEVKKSS